MGAEERRIILERGFESEDRDEGEDQGGDKDGSTDGSNKIPGRRITRRRARGGLLTTVGFILSPVSWWNDLFINIPLAYAFGALLALISRDLFLPAMVVGYWITNLLGFVLMHRGMKDLLSKDGGEGRRRRDLLVDISVSIAYTVIVVILVAAGVLRLPAEYFP
jgi:hypothetical protein